MTGTEAPPPTPEPPPLRGAHSTNFGPMLPDLGLSVLVTTCHSSQLVGLHEHERQAQHPLPDFPRADGLGWRWWPYRYRHGA